MVTRKDLLKYKTLMVKSNYIIESSYKLNLQEQRLIYILTSKINKEDIEFMPYKFTQTEINNILSKHKISFNELSQHIDNLRNRELVIVKEKSILKIKWLSSAEYFEDGSIELCFDDKLKPYLLQLKKRFTKLSLDKVITFNSNYSCRIYELLKQYEGIGKRSLSIEALRTMFCIGPEEYSRYNDFKRKVLLQAQKEINLNNTDISFEFEEIKTGRKVTSIKFHITQNKAKNEIAIGTVKGKSELQKDMTLIKHVQAIIKSVVGNEISDKIAKTFYTKAVKHKEYGNAPFDLIEEVAKYSKTQNKEKGFVAWFTGTVEHYIRPSKQKRTEGNSSDTFNDFEQREYDFEDLEKKLLGIK